MSSFVCCDDDIAGGRITVFVKSFRRVGNAFICVLKKPVILVCDRILSALPPVIQFVPDIIRPGDLNPLLQLFRFESL